LGNWGGRRPSQAEWQQLQACLCPACCNVGTTGLRSSGIAGFLSRATHNLWILLQENEWVEEHIGRGDYFHLYKSRIRNSVYAPIIGQLSEMGIGMRCGVIE
jgi:hypothetical protein